jgi:hypothetical protein
MLLEIARMQGVAQRTLAREDQIGVLKRGRESSRNQGFSLGSTSPGAAVPAPWLPSLRRLFLRS